MPFHKSHMFLWKTLAMRVSEADIAVVKSEFNIITWIFLNLNIINIHIFSFITLYVAVDLNMRNRSRSDLSMIRKIWRNSILLYSSYIIRFCSQILILKKWMTNEWLIIFVSNFLVRKFHGKWIFISLWSMAVCYRLF